MPAFIFIGTMANHRISYQRDTGLEREVRRISSVLGMEHIDHSRLAVVRSEGTKSRRVLARCHALSRIFQHALGIRAHYIIEIVSENFDRLPDDEKLRTLIHELMHIPRSFGGGFRHHRPYVNRRTVERAYRKYISRLNNL